MSKNLNELEAKRLLATDLKNIRKRLGAGRPLAQHQRRFVETLVNSSQVQRPASDQKFAKNQSELAVALGVSRQLVAYHARHPLSPKPALDGRHDVLAWREYLAAVSRKPAGEYAIPSAERDDTKKLAAFFAVSNHLPMAIGTALRIAEIAASQPKTDLLVFYTWLALAGAFDSNLQSQGNDSWLAEEGIEYPREIITVAGRIEAQP